MGGSFITKQRGVGRREDVGERRTPVESAGYKFQKYFSEHSQTFQKIQVAGYLFEN